MSYTEEVAFATKEVVDSNGNNLFKRRFAVGRELKVQTKTLPELVALYQQITLSFHQNGKAFLVTFNFWK
ncbi:MAG: hypothetical protein ACTMH4_02105 [Sphingobacterium sp.]